MPGPNFGGHENDALPFPPRETKQPGTVGIVPAVPPMDDTVASATPAQSLANQTAPQSTGLRDMISALLTPAFSTNSDGTPIPAPAPGPTVPDNSGLLILAMVAGVGYLVYRNGR